MFLRIPLRPPVRGNNTVKVAESEVAVSEEQESPIKASLGRRLPQLLELQRRPDTTPAAIAMAALCYTTRRSTPTTSMYMMANVPKYGYPMYVIILQAELVN